MATWSELERTEPDLTVRVRARFEAQLHHTLATLRKDGSPRISGTEVRFEDGDVKLGMMPDSLKAHDLRRDPRLAVHSASEDPPEEIAQHDRWPGDAKFAGRAEELPNQEKPGEPSGWFRIDLQEVTFTKVGTPADHLVIESWHEGRGVERHIRR